MGSNICLFAQLGWLNLWLSVYVGDKLDIQMWAQKQQSFYQPLAIKTVVLRHALWLSLGAAPLF